MTQSSDHAAMKAEIDALSSDVRELRDSVKELVEAWRTATGVVKFVKFIAGFATACAGAWVMLKGVKL